VGRTTLFTPVDINLQQVVDFLNFYACTSQLKALTQKHMPDFNSALPLQGEYKLILN
jgi:hypothetical protein